jgi:hypothetical protein
VEHGKEDSIVSIERKKDEVLECGQNRTNERMDFWAREKAARKRNLIDCRAAATNHSRREKPLEIEVEPNRKNGQSQYRQAGLTRWTGIEIGQKEGRIQSEERRKPILKAAKTSCRLSRN